MFARWFKTNDKSSTVLTIQHTTAQEVCFQIQTQKFVDPHFSSPHQITLQIIDFKFFSSFFLFLFVSFTSQSSQNVTFIFQGIIIKSTLVSRKSISNWFNFHDSTITQLQIHHQKYHTNETDFHEILALNRQIPFELKMKTDVFQ